jgi:hypothetical protein
VVNIVTAVVNIVTAVVNIYNHEHDWAAPANTQTSYRPFRMPHPRACGIQMLSGLIYMRFPGIWE